MGYHAEPSADLFLPYKSNLNLTSASHVRNLILIWNMVTSTCDMCDNQGWDGYFKNGFWFLELSITFNYVVSINPKPNPSITKWK